MTITMTRAMIYKMVCILIQITLGILFLIFSLRIPNKDKMVCIDKQNIEKVFTTTYTDRVETLKWYGFTIGLLLLLSSLGWILSFFFKY